LDKIQDLTETVAASQFSTKSTIKFSNDTFSMSHRTCKIVFLGDSEVGKTALIHRFVEQEYRDDFKATVGADFHTSKATIGDTEIDLQIWDTAGDERFRAIAGTFYRGTNACVLVYSIANRQSFEHITYWYQELLAQASVKTPQSFPFVIFANKADLQEDRVVEGTETFNHEDLARYPVFEVSAKSGQNVEAGVRKLCEMYLEATQNEVNTIALTPVDLTSTRGTSQSCCGS
jgi:Ras-related protein Rab-7A